MGSPKESSMSKWATESSETAVENPWYKVRRDAVRTHMGELLTYNVVEMRHPSVFIVAVNSAGKILLEKNYRYTIDQTIWELPAGHSDGQKPLVAAARELQEETGYTSHDWTVLGRVYQAIGIGNIPLDVCLARDVQPGEHHREASELIEDQRFFSLEEIDHMIANNQFVNVTDIGVIQMARIHGLKKEN
jgi:8-oxo-dGTP pyrophosphatase MutT (NUDIX family)